MRYLVIILSFILIRCSPSDDSMIFIEGGTFLMGSTEKTIDSLMNHHGFPRAYIQSETPQHEVTLSSFYIDKFEVTDIDFKHFLMVHPEWRKENIPDSLNNGKYLEHWNQNNYPVGEDKYPVYNVSWYASVAYCAWQKKRLPTEAEWEFVATNRGEGVRYSWGNTDPDSTKANYNNFLGTATEVGSYPPNKLGIYDLTGNVWEYMMDEWSANFYSNSIWLNPVNGPKNWEEKNFLNVKTRRVIRGGSWGGADLNLRSAFRDSHPANGSGNHVECRCVREVIQK